ncbi:MAG TPA: DUF3667 domain-containing protein [Flavobacterium sp.]|nr:DUF3667 domain-containing protein [Flavobacterium sp.]
METNICINCNNTFTGLYCNRCGQKVFTNKDKSIKGIAEEAFHFATHFEGKFFTTLQTVISRPGKLSRDYCNGIRQRYYKPMSFFLMLIIIYLLFPYMEGLNMRLEYYRGVVLTGDLITQQIDNKLIESGLTENELGKIFRQKSEKIAKVLLLILIPLTAAALHLLFFRRRKTAYDYMVLATEINIFVLLVFFLIFPLLLAIAFTVANVQTMDESIFTPFMLVVFIAALMQMFRSFFRESWLSLFIKSTLFLLLYFVISQIIYKSLLFELTFLLI